MVFDEHVATRSQLHNVNDGLRQAHHNLSVELGKVKASHIKLENQLSNLQTVNEDEIRRLQRIVKELSEKKIDDLDTLMKNISDSVLSDVTINAELCEYRVLLDSEADRTRNQSMSSPIVKRRRTNEVNYWIM